MIFIFETTMTFNRIDQTLKAHKLRLLSYDNVASVFEVRVSGQFTHFGLWAETFLGYDQYESLDSFCKRNYITVSSY